MKRILLLILVVFMVLLCGGCATRKEINNSNESQATADSESTYDAWLAKMYEAAGETSNQEGYSSSYEGWAQKFTGDSGEESTYDAWLSKATGGKY